MKITSYKTIPLRRELSGIPTDQTCRHVVPDRKAGKVYLYNKDYALTRILTLSDYGIVDASRGIPHAGHSIQVAEGPRLSFACSPERQLLCVWHEQTGLTLYGFDGQQHFHLPEPVCHACFDVRDDLLWVVRRDSNEAVTLLLFDYSGGLAAQLSMKDELYGSSFDIQPLSRPHQSVIDFAGGQDGSQSYFLERRNGALSVIKKLPPSLTCLFELNQGTEALLLDFYDMVLWHKTLPGLEEVGRFCYPVDEWSIGAVVPVNDRRLVLSNEYNYRHYLFDVPSMSITEEIVLEGHEPAPDTGGVLCTDIQGVFCKDGELVFQTTQKQDGLVQDLLLVVGADTIP